MHPGREKRSHQRVPIDCEVTCHPANGEPFTGRAKDICLGGMFIECDRKVEYGANLTITTVLPTAKAFLELPGVVRWHHPGGFGVQFGLLGARETHALTEYGK